MERISVSEMSEISIEGLEWQLKRAWDAGTSAAPGEWSPMNVSRGQCAITALVVQDRFGGELLRTTVNGESHYFNRLPGGKTVDLTLDQFGGALPETPPEVRSRQYVLGFENTRKRYARLISRLWG